MDLDHFTNVHRGIIQVVMVRHACAWVRGALRQHSQLLCGPQNDAVLAQTKGAIREDMLQRRYAKLVKTWGREDGTLQRRCRPPLSDSVCLRPGACAYVQGTHTTRCAHRACGLAPRGATPQSPRFP